TAIAKTAQRKAVFRRFRRNPIVPAQPAKAIAAGAGDFIPMKRISLDTEISWPCELLLGLDEEERQ
ncbi:MAG: hypothetical protein OXG23_04890, partial [Chloroflexi bacterium]|nr:hypothetical protein [Chloroflexota bacterium]